MIGGRFVLRDSRVVPVDIRDLRRQVSAAVDRLSHATADAKALAARIEPHVVAFADSLFGEPLGIERLLAPSCG
jgi:5-methylthioadenosine/S-adenosylhomocysteine deaminase